MYQFVNVRFNLNNEEEKVLYEKLNPKNRGGNIKKVLKQHFLFNEENSFKKAYLKEIIREIVINQSSIINTENDSKINKSNSSNEIIIRSGGFKLL